MIVLYSVIFSWVKIFVDFVVLKKIIHENKGIYYGSHINICTIQYIQRMWRIIFS